ncbi:MAG: SEC-C metal-binding domain-containing protein [bacterium]
MFSLPSIKSPKASSKTSENHHRKKFDVSKPRLMYWSDELLHSKICPECNAKLENESHTYLLATRDSGNIDAFIMGCDGGYFCSICPVIVLDREMFKDMALIALRSVSSFEYRVLGIVDLDAVPREKSHIPLGEDDNPIPLVEFLNRTDVSNSKDHQEVPTSKNNVTVGRNSPCPCGSGKKYKKMSWYARNRGEINFQANIMVRHKH